MLQVVSWTAPDTVVVLDCDAVINVADACTASTEWLSTLYTTFSSSFQAAIYSTFLRWFVESEWVVTVGALAFLVHAARLLGQADQIGRNIVLILALVTTAITRVLETVRI